ncbi:hypothetical protein EYF80_021702 [Liparis tanakae]|uniref:Uncharacterized protein n=1 Tax=Liparis tanakae TaxID=230148 RepID=A0A4Z2HQQ8_9TELE|nr:hypothetical protein EYF80_021702 [Liparis tanakae]
MEKRGQAQLFSFRGGILQDVRVSRTRTDTTPGKPSSLQGDAFGKNVYLAPTAALEIISNEAADRFNVQEWNACRFSRGIEPAKTCQDGEVSI